MKSKGNFVRTLSLMMAVLVLATTLAVPALAATEYGVGEHYLGNFEFTDYNAGASRIYNAKYMRLKIAWKKGEGIFVNSDIDLAVDLQKSATGNNVRSFLFKPVQDTDGKDNDGYYYVVTGWFEIDNGDAYRLVYEAFTADGNEPTGHWREADVHTWIELTNTRPPVLISE